jgi:hypothetical protein
MRDNSPDAGMPTVLKDHLERYRQTALVSLPKGKEASASPNRFRKITTRAQDALLTRSNDAIVERSVFRAEINHPI